MAPVLCAILAAGVAGCEGEQSALWLRGAEAERIGLLFWVTTAFLALVLVATVVAGWLAVRGSPKIRSAIADDRFVIGAGLFFPMISLAALLVWSLTVMAQRPVATDAPFAVRVVGEQWWWRVIYRLPDGTEFESANELRIPVGRPVTLTLESADVIHSFWVPNLAGKVDMIPGRANRLTLEALEAGVSRGQCAEYCGGAHALMAFHVAALDEGDFARWLAAERRPARAGDAGGAVLFRQFGCGACHRVRGMPGAAGRIGPDLTHVGSRRAIGAATLPNGAEAIARWIAENQHIKPDNRMPAYRILSPAELRRLADFLADLT
ncbi:cytochrome c oxidase subunit II [Allostella sp. ATCC 35155]|nr:cytochrome c oxidase subunit II [Stella sp. ATCC 35155]